MSCHDFRARIDFDEPPVQETEQEPERWSTGQRDQAVADKLRALLLDRASTAEDVAAHLKDRTPHQWYRCMLVFHELRMRTEAQAAAAKLLDYVLHRPRGGRRFKSRHQLNIVTLASQAAREALL